MEYHILESVHQDVLFLRDLSGGVWPMMYVTGFNPAFLVSEERFSAMFKFAQRRFLFPSEDSHMYPWFHISLHVHRQVNKMAGSYTSGWNLCVGVCLLHVSRMDIEVWRFCSYYK